MNMTEESLGKHDFDLKVCGIFESLNRCRIMADIIKKMQTLTDQSLEMVIPLVETLG